MLLTSFLGKGGKAGDASNLKKLKDITDLINEANRDVIDEVGFGCAAVFLRRICVSFSAHEG